MSLRATISVRNMAHSARSIRLAAASLVAILMVSGAYVFSGPNPLSRIAEAQSAEELLREYAAKDTDTDGLPDWQEALYGTDPNNSESFQAGISDGDAVAQGLVEPKVVVRAPQEATDPDSLPGTTPASSSLTDRFAQNLLAQYLQNRGEQPPTQEEILTFVESSVADLSQSSVSPDVFAASSVRVSGASGADALVAYAVSAQNAFAANTVPASISSKNELSYFQDALRGDDSALEKIEAISEAYAAIGRGLMEVPVPADARQAHLTIANALMRLSETTGDMTALRSDPLRALMGIAMYEKQGTGLQTGFANLAAIFSARQVTIPSGAPGYEIYNTSQLATQ